MGLPTIASRWGASARGSGRGHQLVRWTADLIDVPNDCELFKKHLYQGHRCSIRSRRPGGQDARDRSRLGCRASRRRAGAPAALIEVRFGPDATANTLREAARACSLWPTRPGRRRHPWSLRVRGVACDRQDDSPAAYEESRRQRLHTARREASRFVTSSPGSPTPGLTIQPGEQGPTVMVIPWKSERRPPNGGSNARAAGRNSGGSRASTSARGFVAAGLPAGIVEVVPERLRPRPLRTQRHRPWSCQPALREYSCSSGARFWRRALTCAGTTGKTPSAPTMTWRSVIKDFRQRSWLPRADLAVAGAGFAGRADVARSSTSDQEIPAGRMAYLYRAARRTGGDISGEGFCMPALEAMAWALPGDPRARARPESSVPSPRDGI